MRQSRLAGWVEYSEGLMLQRARLRSFACRCSVGCDGSCESEPSGDAAAVRLVCASKESVCVSL